MPDYNQVILIGRCTRDPELRFTPSQQAICNFGLAVGRKFKDGSGEKREEVSFFDLQCWGKGGELIAQYCKKGSPLFVSGRIKQDSWTDKTSGDKRSKVIVVVEDFQFLGGRDSGNQGGDETSQAPPSRPNYGQRSPAKTGAPQPPYGEEQQFTDSDLPF